MSSRLKILPKKSFCPWSEENVQKVLRDEAQHDRDLETANERKKRDHWDEEDGTNNLASNYDGHFSLFAKEEKKARLDQELNTKEKEKYEKRRKLRQPFVQSTSAAMDAAVGLKSREHKHTRRDAASKNRLDPMSGFCQNYRAEKDVTRVDRDHASPSTNQQKSKSERDRGRSHNGRWTRRRRSPSSSSSSSEDSSSSSNSSSSRRRHRKRRRDSSKSRKSGNKSSSMSSSSSNDDNSSQHKQSRRRKRRHGGKPRSKRADKSKSKTM